MECNRLYDDLADLFPLLTPREEYAEEAEYWRRALRDTLGPGRHEVLELGVGGGHNLSHLTSDFQATAVDISERMLALSRRLNPGVEHIVGDMRTVRLGRRFKAVLIHDAISYMLTEDDLRATFHTAAAHLEPGGVIVTSPDRFRDTFVPPAIGQAIHSDGETELTYFAYTYDPDPEDTTIETIMFYVIRNASGLRTEQDRHVNGLFPLQTWIDLLNEAGFEVEQRPYVRMPDSNQGILFVGRLG